MTSTTLSLALATVAIALLSLLLSPRARTGASFYEGRSPAGAPPTMWALALSQVTTWIFARSIMNAAILGYYYGIAGAGAYAAYYLSFLTGAWIIASLRYRHGFSSVQGFLHDRFGTAGTACYNAVIGLRLVSEVFANLLVIGLIFGATGSTTYVTSILAVGLVTAAYSMAGGLHAAIRTDVYQALTLIIVLAALLLITLLSGSLDVEAIVASTPTVESPGWVLLAVALLQVWSYPMHDPVMMDRGFIADRRATMNSFYHAAWIATLCILAFGLIGVWAGLGKLPGETLVPTLTRLYGATPMLLFNIALIVSCMSTLDSTFSSAAKLSVIDMKFAEPTVANGRLAMAAFLAGGLLLTFFGPKDLFSAVAVSGTAAMYLTPVVIFSLWLGWRDVPVWSYVVSFVTAVAAAVLYFAYADASYGKALGPLFGFEHKYSKLLILCVGVLVISNAAFVIGHLTNARQRVPAAE